MEIDEALRLLNDWWKSGKAKAELAKGYKRPVFEEAYRLLERYRQVVILTGLRRVGKTTIMYQIIERLLKQVSSLNIIYFAFDCGAAEVTSILNAYQKITGSNWKEEKIYLFLDEIQILPNWASQIKLIYDAFPNVHFIISGSASLQLERRAMDSLAGRHFLIDIPVLSINEYYSLKHDKIINSIKLFETDIGLEFESYIRKPFPELAKIDDEKRIYEYIQESVVSKIISQDLLQEFEKVDIPMLNSLVEIFFYEPGMILNIDSLSKTLAKRKQEVERHIYMLEFSKLIRVIKNYRPSMLSESRKLRKIYPYDISLALAKNPSIEKEKILETLVISRLDIKRYWRDGSKEIDALLGNGRDIIPIEIKSSSSLREDYMKNLNYFISKFGAKYGVLLYNGKKIKMGKIMVIDIKNVLIYGFEKSAAVVTL
ncbi:MAG: ATP-binding protein [Candidatus Marsarchaeota archaeon]|nr:ATP-binding protein [Candidatus Marsarchaeota archaeon]MCL5106166.1 ATP-binding protein [Candidatus Marsarchaeota archaeon]